jgi:SAM-dependent methyltransferase
MTADGTIYSSERLAAAYAFSRPPVHPYVAPRVSRRLSPECPVDIALDIGCGAGASTAAILPLAGRVVGLDPYVPMLRYASVAVPGATFYVGRAEALPFQSSAFALVTAAGTLNYADVELSLSEVARVMSPSGLFVPYDFSAGRRLRDDNRLTDWYAEFRARFPSPPGYALDLRALEYHKCGLNLVAYEALEVGIQMSLATYVDYILGDAGVESALSGGRLEEDVRRFLEDRLHPVFSVGEHEVIFDAQIAYIRSRANSGYRSEA